MLASMSKTRSNKSIFPVYRASEAHRGHLHQEGLCAVFSGLAKSEAGLVVHAVETDPLVLCHAVGLMEQGWKLTNKVVKT